MVPQSGAEGSSAGTPRCTISCGCGHGEGQQCSCFSEIDCDVHTTQHIQHAPPARRKLGTCPLQKQLFTRTCGMTWNSNLRGAPQCSHGGMSPAFQGTHFPFSGLQAAYPQWSLQHRSPGGQQWRQSGRGGCGHELAQHVQLAVSTAHSGASCSPQHAQQKRCPWIEVPPSVTNISSTELIHAVRRSPAAGMRLQLGHRGRAAASKQYRRHCDGSLPTCRAASNVASWVNKPVPGQPSHCPAAPSQGSASKNCGTAELRKPKPKLCKLAGQWPVRALHSPAPGRPQSVRYAKLKYPRREEALSRANTTHPHLEGGKVCPQKSQTNPHKATPVSQHPFHSPAPGRRQSGAAPATPAPLAHPPASPAAPLH